MYAAGVGVVGRPHMLENSPGMRIGLFTYILRRKAVFALNKEGQGGGMSNEYFERV